MIGLATLSRQAILNILMVLPGLYFFCLAFWALFLRLGLRWPLWPCYRPFGLYSWHMVVYFWSFQSTI